MDMDRDPPCVIGEWQLSVGVQEFTTAAANPKALLLFTAFLPQFTMKSAGPVAYQLTLCFTGLSGTGG